MRVHPRSQARLGATKLTRLKLSEGDRVGRLADSAAEQEVRCQISDFRRNQDLQAALAQFAEIATDLKRGCS
jgi:hypothetical protein